MTKVSKKDLSEHQLKFILDNGDKMELMEITRKVFDDPTLDGRSAEGRLIRKILADNQIDYKTSKHNTVDDIELTEEHKEFINQHAINLKAYEIARILFKDNNIGPLSKSSIVIQEYIKNTHPSLFKKEDEMASDEYKPPNTFKRMLSKINEISGLSLEEDKLNVKAKKNIEQCLIFCQSVRFLSYMRTLEYQHEREMFEAEFIGTVWNKPDLTRDEVNLSVNLCKEYINQLKIEKTIATLDKLLDAVTGDNEGKITMSLAESIKNYREDLKKSVNIQQAINRDLNGRRKERLDKQLGGQRSIAQLVEFVQEEENRNLLEKTTQIRKRLLAQTMDDFTTADEIVARVYGVRKEDILEW